MAIQAEASGNYENTTAGIHNAVLAQVVDLGNLENKFYDPNVKGSRPTTRQIVYVFQLESRKTDNTRFLKEFWFNLSANEKSNIAKFLNSWSGKSLTAAELQLDHEKMVGRGVQLILTENKNQKIIITSAAPTNPNNLLTIEPYDTAEYERQLKERVLKQEDANHAKTQQFQNQQTYPQPFQQGQYPQQYPQQYQPQNQMPISQMPVRQAPVPNDIIPF
jgi:hypothetical protein